MPETGTAHLFPHGEKIIMSQTENTPTAEQETPTSAQPETDTSSAETAIDWKAKSRQWEDRAKANLSEIERLKPFEEQAKKLGEQFEEATKRVTELESTRQAQALQLAVFRNAGTADPRALLDSKSFMNALKEADVSDDETVAGVIADALKNNPRLSATPYTGGDLSDGHAGSASDEQDMNTLLHQALKG